jgi:hypothetical protein
LFRETTGVAFGAAPEGDASLSECQRVVCDRRASYRVTQESSLIVSQKASKLAPGCAAASKIPRNSKSLHTLKFLFDTS